MGKKQPTKLSVRLFFLSLVLLVISFIGYGLTYEDPDIASLSNIFLVIFMLSAFSAGVSLLVGIVQTMLHLMRKLTAKMPTRKQEEHTMEHATEQSGTSAGRVQPAASNVDSIACPHDSYTFFDIETPNRRNDRICSIGIVRTDACGDILEKRYELVNPETYFDSFNSGLHGIDQASIANKPTFQELWNSGLDAYFDGPVIVAYNASFDIEVLKKTLGFYGITPPPLRVQDALEMARGSSICCDNYKLPTVCEALHICFSNHHSADADADACCRVWWELVKRGTSIPKTTVLTSHANRISDQSSRRPMAKNNKTQLLQCLLETFETVLQDGKVDSHEAREIISLIRCNEDLRTDKTLAAIMPTIEISLLDGTVDDTESAMISRILRAMLDPMSLFSGGVVEIEGKTFVLTGNFNFGPRDRVVSFIESHGGLVNKSVTKKCDYLVVGGRGSSDWSYGNYGGKVKEALDWHVKGSPVQIIREATLFEHLIQ